MRFRALSDGTIGKGPAVRRVRAGEVFSLPAGVKPGKWMQEVSEAPEPEAKKPKAKGKEPTTLSEVSKSLPTPPGADLA